MRGVSGLIGFDGGLNFIKRWVSAVLDNGFSAGHGIGAGLTKDM